MGLFDIAPVRARGGTRHVQLSRPVFTCPNDWRPDTEFPELSGVVGLDSEAVDPGLAQGYGSCWPHVGVGYSCGWGVSTEHRDYYFPLRHADGNIDSDGFYRWLRAQAAKPDVTFVYAKAPYDLGWLWRQGIEPVNLPHDVQAMGALLDEFAYSYSLDTLGHKYLQRGKNDTEFKAACAQAGLNDPMAHMDLVPAWIAEPYGKNDAALTRALYFDLIARIRAEGLEDVYELERECLLVAVDMKRQGVRVDVAKAERLAAEFARKRDEYLMEVQRLSGVLCTATDNAALARALKAENPELDLPRTEQGRDSIRKDVIAGLHSPVANAINAARRYEKARGTFLQGYILGHAVNGRIHADFDPTRRVSDSGDGSMSGTVSGRWSCSNPNLQNVSARDPEIAGAVRGCFLPDEGARWAKFDYASQEPRLTVHYAEWARLPGAREMAERFRQNAHTDLHAETAQLMGVPRQQAKIINLSLAYGAGGAKLCKQLGLPTNTIFRNGREIEVAGAEGQRLLDIHMRGVPFMRQLQKLTEERAQQRGFVKTILGRRCRFQQDGQGKYKWTYAALNRVIQGSASDMCKKAMVNLRRAGIFVQLTVHDEVDVSVPLGDNDLVPCIKQLMEGALPLSIPVVVDVKEGPNWGACAGS